MHLDCSIKGFSSCVYHFNRQMRQMASFRNYPKGVVLILFFYNKHPKVDCWGWLTENGKGVRNKIKVYIQFVKTIFFALTKHNNISSKAGELTTFKSKLNKYCFLNKMGNIILKSFFFCVEYENDEHNHAIFNRFRSRYTCTARKRS